MSREFIAQYRHPVDRPTRLEMRLYLLRRRSVVNLYNLKSQLLTRTTITPVLGHIGRAVKSSHSRYTHSEHQPPLAPRRPCPDPHPRSLHPRVWEWMMSLCSSLTGKADRILVRAMKVYFGIVTYLVLFFLHLSEAGLHQL